jgi:hypothetical protein
MRQHRMIALLVALAAALVIPTIGATAPGDSVRGPGCGDITLSNPDETDPPLYTTRDPNDPTLTTDPTVYALLTTAKLSCSGAVYTITLSWTDSSGQTQTVTQTYLGDGLTSSFSFTHSFSSTSAPSEVCISAMSELRGRVVDAAPNSGCGTRLLNGGVGGGSGYG